MFNNVIKSSLVCWLFLSSLTVNFHILIIFTSEILLTWRVIVHLPNDQVNILYFKKDGFRLFLLCCKCDGLFNWLCDTRSFSSCPFFFIYLQPQKRHLSAGSRTQLEDVASDDLYRLVILILRSSSSRTVHFLLGKHKVSEVYVTLPVDTMNMFVIFFWYTSTNFIWSIVYILLCLSELNSLFNSLQTTFWKRPYLGVGLVPAIVNYTHKLSCLLTSVCHLWSVLVVFHLMASWWP